MPAVENQALFDRDQELAGLASDYEAGRLPERQARYREILKTAPDHADVLYVLGISEAQLGHFAEALVSIDHAIHSDPKIAQYHLSRGIVLQQMGRLEDAILSYRAALKLAPDDDYIFAATVNYLARSVRGARIEDAISSPQSPVDQGKKNSLSVIVCSIDEKKRRHIREHYEKLLVGYEFEIIQILGANSLCEGYNRGFRKSSGDVVIFSHDDIEIVSENFAARLLRHFETSDVIGVAGTSRLVGLPWPAAGWPYLQGNVVHRRRDATGFSIECYGPPRESNLQALDGLFFAAKRGVCEAVPFDEKNFDGFHFYDLDFTFRTYRAGYRSAVCWDILVLHDSGGAFDSVWEGYARKFVSKYHGEILPPDSQKQARWAAVDFENKGELSEFHRRMLKALDIQVL